MTNLTTKLESFSTYIYSADHDFRNDGFPVSSFMEKSQERYNRVLITKDSIDVFLDSNLVEKIPMEKALKKYNKIQPSVINAELL